MYNLVRIRLKAVRAAVIIENRIKNSKYTNRYKESKKDIFGNQKEGLSDKRVKLNNFAKSEKSNCKKRDTQQFKQERTGIHVKVNSSWKFKLRRA